MQGFIRLKIWCRKFVKLYRHSDRFFYPLVGMPSYDKYLEHMEIYHPDEIPKTRQEFFSESMEAKYGSGRSRC